MQKYYKFIKIEQSPLIITDVLMGGYQILYQRKKETGNIFIFVIPQHLRKILMNTRISSFRLQV